MLTIRNKQKSVFDLAARQDFENSLLKLIRKLYGNETSRMGEKDIRTIIEKGMEKSFKHNLKTEQEIALYIGLMIGLDSDFEEREETAWTNDILVNSELEGIEKMELIYRLLAVETTGADKKNNVSRDA